MLSTHGTMIGQHQLPSSTNGIPKSSSGNQNGGGNRHSPGPTSNNDPSKSITTNSSPTSSIDEEVRTLFVSGLPMDTKPRELNLLFRAFKGFQFDPDFPQTLRLEFARSNTKVHRLKPQNLRTPNRFGFFASASTSREQQTACAVAAAAAAAAAAQQRVMIPMSALGMLEDAGNGGSISSNSSHCSGSYIHDAAAAAWQQSLPLELQAIHPTLIQTIHAAPHVQVRDITHSDLYSIAAAFRQLDLWQQSPGCSSP